VQTISDCDKIQKVDFFPENQSVNPVTFPIVKLEWI